MSIPSSPLSPNKRQRIDECSAVDPDPSTLASEEESEDNKTIEIPLTRDVLNKILSAVVTYQSTHPLAAMKDLHAHIYPMFLPNVDAYIGKKYVQLHIELAGGEVRGNWVTDDKEWTSIVESGDDFHLGMVQGKYSDTSIPYDDYWWKSNFERDPYKIAQLVAVHGNRKPHWIVEYLEKYAEEHEETHEDDEVDEGPAEELPEASDEE